MKFKLALCLLSAWSLGLSLGASEPLSLYDVEKIAFQQNQAYQQARLSAQAQLATKRVDFAAYLPQISYSASRRQASKPSPYFSGTRFYSSRFQLSQQLLSTNTWFRYRSSAAKFQASAFDFLQVGSQLLTDVRKAYFAVALAARNLQIQEAEVSLLQSDVKNERLKAEQGYATDFQKLQSEVALAQALASYYSALRELHDAKLGLNQLMGFDSTHIDKWALQNEDLGFEAFHDLQEFVSLFSSSLEARGITAHHLVGMDLDALQELFEGGVLGAQVRSSWLARAIENNPSLKAQEQQVKAAKAGYREQIGKYVPDISAEVNYVGPEGSGTSFGSLKYRWESTIRLNWSLFDSFARENSVKKARYLFDSQLAGQQLLLNKVSADVEKAFIRLEETILQYLIAEEAVRLSELNLELAEQQKIEEVITTLDFLEVVKANRDVHHLLSTSIYQVLSSYFDLLNEAGENLSYIETLDR